MKAKVTIGGKEHEITLTDEQIKQVNSTWRDEYLKMFPLVGYGSICISSTSRSSIIEFCFPNTEITNKVLSKTNLLIEMTQFALLRNDGCIPNKSTSEFGICYTQVGYSVCRNYDDFVFGITVKSKEIAEEMLDIFKEDIEKYY
jgi:hypothetical protein